MSAETDAYLDSVLIGGREQRPVVVVDYDAAWPARYAELAAIICDAVGTNALSVEHIGSTAVPGLAAKPIIDILITVADVSDESAYVVPLERAGFILRVREPGHRMLRTPSKEVHVHVLAPGSDEVARHRGLRDWLRVDDADRGLYAATKKRLALMQWSDMNYYAAAKSEVIGQILEHASRWRGQATLVVEVP